MRGDLALRSAFSYEQHESIKYLEHGEEECVKGIDAKKVTSPRQCGRSLQRFEPAVIAIRLMVIDWSTKELVHRGASSPISETRLDPVASERPSPRKGQLRSIRRQANSYMTENFALHAMKMCTSVPQECKSVHF